MTIEPEGGRVTRVPAWLYWSFVFLAASIPTLIGADVFVPEVQAGLCAVSAGLAVLIGKTEGGNGRR